jgi:hypothetical protein
LLLILFFCFRKATTTLKLSPLEPADAFALVLDALGIVVDDKSDQEKLHDALVPALDAAQGSPRLLGAIAGACARKHLAVTDASGRLSHVDREGIAELAGECSFMYRYILRESCSQFDSLPLTSLTILHSTGHADDLQATVVQVAIDACSPAAARLLSVASTLEEPFSRALLRGVAMEVEVVLEKR